MRCVLCSSLVLIGLGLAVVVAGCGPSGGKDPAKATPEPHGVGRAEREPRKFNGVLHTGVHRLDGKEVPLFYDFGRASFPPGLTEKQADEFLSCVASDASAVKLGLEIAEAVAGTDDIEFQGKKPKECVQVVLCPRVGISAQGRIGDPTTFATGKIKSLAQIVEKFGESTEREQWSGQVSQELGLDGIVHWWGTMGIASSQDGAITHLLLRREPAKANP